MKSRHRERVTDDPQLQLAIENLADLKDMAPALFKGVDVSAKRPASERRALLKSQVQEITRRKA